MIDILASLIEKSGASHINLKVSTIGDAVTVIINPTLKPLNSLDNLSPEFIALRETLSSPLVIKGHKGEVDVTISEALSDFIESFTPDAATHNKSSELKVPLNSSIKKSATKKPTESISVETPKDVEVTVNNNADDFLPESADSL